MIMLTHYAPSRLVMTLLILLLFFMSCARGGSMVESHLHHFDNEITQVEGSYCEHLASCLMVDHHHLEIQSMSETTHFFLHAIDALEGKMMVGVVSAGAVFLAAMPLFFVSLPWGEPIPGALFRPPR